jgi:hypothetical protein
VYFALIRETPLVTERDLYWLARVLEGQAQEFCAEWQLEPPALDVVAPRTPLPDFCQPVVFVDDDSNPDALAVHYVDLPRLQPAARVYVPRASGFNSGPWPVTGAASHEVLEALADPWCDQWRAHPDPARSGVDVALEVADPPQTVYSVTGHDGDVLVANYVTPSWFDPSLWNEENRTAFLKAGGRFDRKGELTRPGEVGPSGYVILRTHDEFGDSVWTEERVARVPAASAPPFPWEAKPGNRHPWARTERRRKGR